MQWSQSAFPPPQGLGASSNSLRAGNHGVLCGSHFCGVERACSSFLAVLGRFSGYHTSYCPPCFLIGATCAAPACESQPEHAVHGHARSQLRHRQASRSLSSVRMSPLGLGIDNCCSILSDCRSSSFDLVASAIAIATVAVLTVLFSKTRMGVSLRAVADDGRRRNALEFVCPHILADRLERLRTCCVIAGLLGARVRVSNFRCL